MTSLFASPAAAEPRPRASVLVLEAPSGGWKEGVQAVVAELLTSGYELTVRAARIQALDQLESELARQIAQSGFSVGVSVTRVENRGTVRLCREASPCERLEIPIDDEELARSRLALTIVERLRPIELQLSAPPPPRPAPQEPEPKLPEPRRPALSQQHSARFRAWLGGGGVWSSGVSAPLSWASASLGATLDARWGLELGLGGSPLSASARTYAGSLSVRALSAAAFATFEPFSQRGWSLVLGLGGGSLHLRESAAAAPGFDAFSQTATVGLVSARARVQYSAAPFLLGLTLDPGLLVPAIKIDAGQATVLRMGRPWVALQASVGVAL